MSPTPGELADAMSMMAGGAADLRALVDAYRDASAGDGIGAPAAAVLDVFVAQRWDDDRLAAALLMATVALATGMAPR